jgi:hypothetical protein
MFSTNVFSARDRDGPTMKPHIKSGSDGDNIISREAWENLDLAR